MYNRGICQCAAFLSGFGNKRNATGPEQPTVAKYISIVAAESFGPAFYLVKTDVGGNIDVSMDWGYMVL